MFTYADSRCTNQVIQLRQDLNELEVQQRTGCRLHTSYLTPRLKWLHDTDPDTFGAVRHWMSLGEYVYLRLLGVTAAGTSTAAWTGMLDRRTATGPPSCWTPVASQLSSFRRSAIQTARSTTLIKRSAAGGRPWPTRCGFRLSPMASRATLGPAPGMNRRWRYQPLLAVQCGFS